MADTYLRLLTGHHELDFVEACDRILFEDEWFPTIARIGEMTRTCAVDRQQRDRRRQIAAGPVIRSLVCPSCHGARFVRRGGYSPLNVKAGDAESRSVACPGCTVDGRFNAAKESDLIARRGGVPNPNGPVDIDRNNQTWPDALHGYRLPDGRMDIVSLSNQPRTQRLRPRRR